jgi:hypothetical protein
MLRLKLFPIFKQKSLKLGPSILMSTHATPNGEDKTPLKENKNKC